MPYTTVRRVLPHEYPKYRKHLKALDRESKTLRFANPLTDDAIDKLCDDWEKDHEHNILFAIEDDNLDLIAVTHIAIDEKHEMELAFSVLKEYQGQGMGNHLMKRAIQWCRTHNFLHGHMVCLSTNRVIKHLCTKYGIHMESEYGETLADIHLDHPSLKTYVEEATSRNLAVMDYWGKRFARPLAMLK
jgi:GNAT superfamily N-acetyltransferase